MAISAGHIVSQQLQQSRLLKLGSCYSVIFSLAVLFAVNICSY